MPSSLAFGTWPSPIDARAAARASVIPRWPVTLGEEAWWVETRPSEGGRAALCRTTLDEPVAPPRTVLPAPWNTRSRVHEYGGLPYTIFSGALGPVVVFSEFSDQRLYRCEVEWFDAEPAGEPALEPIPVPITPRPEAPSAARYVEPLLSPDASEIWCVRELRTGPAPTDVARAIVAVPLDGSAAADPAAVRVLVADHRFLTCPRLSSGGERLMWIGWDPPDMPWDSTVLRLADVEASTARAPAELSRPRTIAGGPGQAVVQAEWGGPDTVYCVTDPAGWWNLHQLTIDKSGEAERAPVNLCQVDEEFGGPLWQSGSTWFRPMRTRRIVATHGRSAMSLGVVSADSGVITELDTPHTDWLGQVTLGGPSGATAVGVACSPFRAHEVAAVSTADGSWYSLSRPGTEHEPDAFEAYLPEPDARVFTGEGGRLVHANLYPPRNPGAAGDGKLPPYVIFVHGGPTQRAPVARNLAAAYFTSRGIGVAEVNYGGSTGHGRAYRERLHENWGIVDVEDCVASARALAEEGLADADRLAIRGGSAGGWTAAAALAFSDTFACGAISFPILDLASWREETHDFEAHYLEGLVGPWPETAERYARRSPLNHVGDIAVPFLLMQGLEDEICPPAQCERFLERLAEHKRAPYAYLAFEGEQHGFRKESTIVAALEAELSLYAQVFGFEAPGIPRLELSV